MEELFEKERELINRYNVLSKDIRIAEQILKNFGQLSEEVQKTYDSALAEREELQSELLQLEHKPLTNKKVRILVSQIEAICSAIEEIPQGYKISRNQGTIFETAIFSLIIRDIEWALNSYSHFWHTPKYYHSVESDFDERPLTELLTNFANDLKKNGSENYIDLESKVENLIAEIQNLASNIYKIS